MRIFSVRGNRRVFSFPPRAFVETPDAPSTLVVGWQHCSESAAVDNRLDGRLKNTWRAGFRGFGIITRTAEDAGGGSGSVRVETMTSRRFSLGCARGASPLPSVPLRPKPVFGAGERNGCRRSLCAQHTDSGATAVVGSFCSHARYRRPTSLVPIYRLRYEGSPRTVHVVYRILRDTSDHLPTVFSVPSSPQNS